MGIFDSSDQPRSRRRTRTRSEPGPDVSKRVQWRAEGKFYEFTGYSDEGVGHPVTVTVYADRITLTPGHKGAPASELASRLPVRGMRVEDVALRAVERVEVEPVAVTQAQIQVVASPTSLTLRCLRTVAEQVRHDLEAAVSEAMIAAARQAVPEAPIPVVANLLSMDDSAARIEQLAGLRDRGLLSETEFEAKKRQILGL